MSSEWVSVKLKDVATIRNGAGIKQNFFDTDGVPLVRVTNFTDTSIDLKDSVRVNVDHALKWQNHKLKAQDILIATVGSWPPNWSSVVGKAVSVPAAVAGAIQNQNTCCIQAIPGMADQRFLYYLARSQNFALYAANSASGSANQARLPVAKLECFEFHLPSLAEQKSIGSFLGALDDRITLLRETNATLEAIAQALFKSWFVDFDPVHANAAFLENGQAPSLPAEIQALFPSRLVESPQGLIPEGWEIMPFGDFIERMSVGKKFDQKSALEDGLIPILDQGRSGIIGFHNEAPGVKASLENPVVVFANHTCYMRLVTFDFSAIQNVLPFTGKGVDTVWAFYATKDRIKFSEYKGHWPDFAIEKSIVPPKTLTELFRNKVDAIVRSMRNNELRIT